MMKTRSNVLAITFALALASSLYAVPPTLEWTRQFGKDTSEYGLGVSTDSLGNVYISGYTENRDETKRDNRFDVFIRKYDSAGTVQWTNRLGADVSHLSYSVSADSLGNVYISGYTRGSLVGGTPHGKEAFLSKFDANGTLQWSEQLGTSGLDTSYSVSADSLGNVYISGAIDGLVGAPTIPGNTGEDVFLSKYNDAGTLQWTERLGTSSVDISYGVSSDSLGNVYISGFTLGNLGGPNAGGPDELNFESRDAFVSKYDSTGTLEWTEQFGTSSLDESRGVSADSFGNVYLAGYTQGDLSKTNGGNNDAFLVKFNVVPEPTSCLLATLAGLFGLGVTTGRRKKTGSRNIR